MQPASIRAIGSVSDRTSLMKIEAHLSSIFDSDGRLEQTHPQT
jgi:hypothetical protein